MLSLVYDLSDQFQQVLLKERKFYAWKIVKCLNMTVMK